MPAECNERIRLQLEQSVLYYSLHDEEIGLRLVHLDREWDIERLLSIIASILALLGLLAAVVCQSSWLLLFAMTGLVFMLQNAIQGWTPPLSLLRRLGVRTRDEILAERYALRSLLGEFDQFPTTRALPPGQRVRTILTALR
jgi:hypothetical protein